LQQCSERQGDVKLTDYLVGKRRPI